MQVLNLSDTSSLLAATVAFSIGASVLLRDRKREQFVLFAVFCFNLGLFHLARFFSGFLHVDLFSWFAETISLLLPWSGDRCLTAIIPPVDSRTGMRVRAALGTSLAVLQVATLALPGLEALIGSSLARAIDIYVVGGLAFVAFRVWRGARAVEGTPMADRLRTLFFASLIALAFASPWVPDVGPIVTAVYLYFVALSLVRDRLLDLPEVVRRIASVGVLVAVITSLYALLLLWIPSGESHSRTLFLFNAAVATFAVLVLLEPVRNEVESKLEGWLFRDRKQLRALLVGLHHKLGNVIDPSQMAKLVMLELKGSGRVTQASLYALDRQGSGFNLMSHLGKVTLARLDLATRRPLLERLFHHGPVLLEALRRERERAEPQVRSELDDMLETLAAVRASLAVPITGQYALSPDDAGKPDLLGALFVDDDRLVDPFSREEIELFKGIAAQAATTLRNSAAYEARKERDRLAALGEMAAGLAHEIRNPLGAIKGAVQVLEPDRRKLDAPSHEFLDVIVEEVDRLNRVVSQFLAYSRPFRGDMGLVDIVAVVDRTIRLIDGDKRECIEVRTTATALPMLLGDADALGQVVHNLLRNALDAVATLIDRAPKVTVTLSVARRGLVRQDAVAIEVDDNGPGLSAHTLTNLFVPFHTTKSGGTGLGLPVTHRIVEHHHGAIEVGESPTGGARFTVLLPVADAITMSSVRLPSEPDPDGPQPQSALPSESS